jgi:hypothetical protein
MSHKQEQEWAAQFTKELRAIKPAYDRSVPAYFGLKIGHDFRWYASPLC